jgi:heptosyltransferase-2
MGYVCDESGRVVPAGESAVAWWMMGLNDRLKAANRNSYQQAMYDLCELPGEIGRPHFVVPDDARERASRFLAEAGIDKYPSLLGLNTGGGRRWEQKKWTVGGYEGLMRLVRERYPGTAVVLLGGPEEVELNARLMAGARDGVFDAGCGNSFSDFAALVQTMDVLVTSDSLGLHAALAVQTPVVVFVGPTSPWELELYGAGTVVHAPGVECLGCYKPACDKPVTCMERLEPEAVLACTEAFLVRSSTPGAVLRQLPGSDPLKADARAQPAPLRTGSACRTNF